MTQHATPVSARCMANPMLMASGRAVDLANLTPADIFWPDLVEALVKMPRFNGATPHVHYSAAQHCCLMYDRAMDGYKAHALLSDFHVAFSCEPPWPFLAFAAAKTNFTNAFMDAIREAKGELTEAIFAAAGLPEDDDDETTFARLKYLQILDKSVTATEVRDLLKASAVMETWHLPAPFKEVIKPWGLDEARAQLELRLAFIGIRTRG